MRWHLLPGRPFGKVVGGPMCGGLLGNRQYDRLDHIVVRAFVPCPCVACSSGRLDELTPLLQTREAQLEGLVARGPASSDA